jgi:hypothetical protein
MQTYNLARYQVVATLQLLRTLQQEPDARRKPSEEKSYRQKRKDCLLEEQCEIKPATTVASMRAE